MARLGCLLLVVGACLGTKVTVRPEGNGGNYSPMELCELGLADGFKTSLGISPDYPSERLLQRLKMAIARYALTHARISLSKRELQEANMVSEILRQLHKNTKSTAATKQRISTGGGALQTNWNLADVIVDGFLASPLVDSIASLTVTNVTMVPGSTTTVYLESPMVNSGQALCAGAGASYLLDPFHDTSYTCALITAVALSTCNQGGPPDCKGSDNWSFRGFPKCTKVDTPEEIDLDVTYTPSARQTKPEEATDLWLFEACSRVTQYYNMAACSNYETLQADMELLPGWDVKHELWYVPEDSTTDLPTPLSLVGVKRSDPCQLVVATRGSSTSYEWQKDFDITTVPLKDSTGQPMGMGHQGMMSFVKVLYPELKTFMTSHFEDNQCKPGQAKITLAGHSMGGGIATLLGLYLSQDFTNLSIVTFASLHVLDSQATHRLMKSVSNIRNWVSEFDPVPYLPCATSVGLPQCSPTESSLFFSSVRNIYSIAPNVNFIPQTGLSKFGEQFGKSSFGRLEYEVNGGKLNLDGLQIAAPLQISTYHTCAYPCYLDQLYCGSPAITAEKCSYC